MEGYLLSYSQGTKISYKYSSHCYRRLWYHLTRYTGKWGRAVNVSTSLTAPVEEGEEKLETDISTTKNASDVSVIDPEIQIFDLYTVGHNPEQTTQPFVHQLNIETGIGGPIRVWANFDDGALANAMSIAKFNTIKHRIGYYRPSSRWLRMADGNLVKPKAMWEGRMVFGSFEVFESGGNWEFLLGKPLLTALHAIHEYTGDTVTIKNDGHSAVLKNQINTMMEVRNEADQKTVLYTAPPIPP